MTMKKRIFISNTIMVLISLLILLVIGGVLEMFFIVFIVAGIVVIAGLLLCCQIFTRWMIKRIMRPVVYDEDDEFGVVCNTFNDMQMPVMDGIEATCCIRSSRNEWIYIKTN